jgi:hypothetical protein
MVANRSRGASIVHHHTRGGEGRARPRKSTRPCSSATGVAAAQEVLLLTSRRHSTACLWHRCDGLCAPRGGQRPSASSRRRRAHGGGPASVAVGCRAPGSRSSARRRRIPELRPPPSPPRPASGATARAAMATARRRRGQLPRQPHPCARLLRWPRWVDLFSFV